MNIWKVSADNHKKKRKTLFQKLPGILCNHKILLIHYFLLHLSFICYKNPWKERKLVNLNIKLKNCVKVNKKGNLTTSYPGYLGKFLIY